MNIVNSIERFADITPNKLAIHDQQTDKKYSYLDLSAEIDKWCNYFSAKDSYF